jgi:hypothetical protein
MDQTLAVVSANNRNALEPVPHLRLGWFRHATRTPSTRTPTGTRFGSVPDVSSRRMAFPVGRAARASGCLRIQVSAPAAIGLERGQEWEPLGQSFVSGRGEGPGARHGGRLLTQPTLAGGGSSVLTTGDARHSHAARGHGTQRRSTTRWRGSWHRSWHRSWHLVIDLWP